MTDPASSHGPLPTVRSGGARRDVVLFAVLVCLGALAAFARNPFALVEPLLFTEDGVWIGLLYFDPVIETYLHTRQDYFVVGNLLLLHLAIVVNEVLFASRLAALPAVVAVESYLVFGLANAIGYFALRRWLPTALVIAILVLVAAVPVGSARSASEIWGRVSNIGFLFSVIAVMAILWRHALVAAGGRRGAILCLDAVLLLACLTNPLAIAFAGLYFGYQIVFGANPSLRRDLPVACMIAAVAASVAIGVVSTPRTDVPDTFTLHDFIVTAVARPLLYPFLFPLYERLDDATAALAGLALAGVLLAALGLSRHRLEYGFLLVCLATQTLAVSLQRTELSWDLGGYSGTYPGRYFYAQSVLVVIAVLWASREIGAAIRLPRALPALATAVLAIVSLSHAALIAHSQQVRCESTPSNFRTQIDLAAADPARPGRITLAICPPGWTMDLPAYYRQRS